MLNVGFSASLCRGDIPSFKLVDTEKTYAFLDIGPLAKGHSLVIPKCPFTLFLFGTSLTGVVPDHGEKLTDIPDEDLLEVLKHCKAIAKAGGFENYKCALHSFQTTLHRLTSATASSKITASWLIKSSRTCIVSV